MANDHTDTISRRGFLKATGTGLVATTVAAGFPAVVPSSVFGAGAPSNRINIGAIGTGRISRGHDMPGVWKYESARIVAVCGPRLEAAGRREAARERLLREEDGQAVRRRHRVRRLPRAAGQQGRRRRADQHARPLARPHRDRRRPGRQGRLPAEAGLAHHRRGAGGRATPSIAAAASSRSAASSAPRRSSATPPSWCATAGSASSRP